MNYSCIGFDVRMWPHQGIFSAEDSLWEQNFEIFNDIKIEFDLNENLYQLLEIENKITLNLIIEKISKNSNCTLVAICIPKSIALVNNEKFGHPAGYDLDLSQFSTMGIDIGDINGFFSILQNSKIKEFRKSRNLFSQNDFQEILETIQLAGFIDKNHAPYCPIKIMSLKI